MRVLSDGGLGQLVLDRVPVAYVNMHGVGLDRSNEPGSAGNADIRGWLASHPRAASSYAKLRIEESYAHIDWVLARFHRIGLARALDVGCGGGHDTFALANRFDDVTAFDASWRRVLAARLLAYRTRVGRIRFQRASAEEYTSAAVFDFIYCNIMSELVSSRRLLAARFAELAADNACVYYAEETEGYTAMEIARAISERDGLELRARLHQLVNGFCGLPLFRFYVSGTAASLFAEYGFELVDGRQKSWHGLVYDDAIWLRRDPRGAHETVGSDPDYAAIDSEFHTMREQFRAVLAGRAASEPQAGNRFTPYLVLLRMATETLGGALGTAPSVAERLRLRAGRVPDPDWVKLEALMAEFMERAHA